MHLLIAVLLFAADEDSTAYKAGYIFGRVLIILLVLGLIVWAIRRYRRG